MSPEGETAKASIWDGKLHPVIRGDLPQGVASKDIVASHQARGAGRLFGFKRSGDTQEDWHGAAAFAFSGAPLAGVSRMRKPVTQGSAREAVCEGGGISVGGSTASAGHSPELPWPSSP